MRAVVQRVTRSKVEVEDQLIGQIDKGLMVLLGVSQDDTPKDIDYMVDKIVNLRIFEDQDDKMNLSLVDVGGRLLVDTHTGKFRSHMMVELVNDGPVTLLIDSKKNF